MGVSGIDHAFAAADASGSYIGLSSTSFRLLADLLPEALKHIQEGVDIASLSANLRAFPLTPTASAVAMHGAAVLAS